MPAIFSIHNSHWARHSFAVSQFFPFLSLISFFPLCFSFSLYFYLRMCILEYWIFIFMILRSGSLLIIDLHSIHNNFSKLQNDKQINVNMCDTLWPLSLSLSFSLFSPRAIPSTLSYALCSLSTFSRAAHFLESESPVILFLLLKCFTLSPCEHNIDQVQPTATIQ